MSELRTTWEKLVAPFHFDDIEIKCMTLSIKDPQNPKALAAPYFNARAVMNRLDEVVGPENWGATYTPIITGTHTGFLCDLWVEIEGKRIERQDAAECTDIESIKGGISDALKRTFAALGSRFLYEIDLGWHACTTYESGGKQKFGGFTQQSLSTMRTKYESAIKGGVPQKPVQAAKQATTVTEDTPEVKAGKFLRKIGLDVKDFSDFKADCLDRQASWIDLALSAEGTGVKTKTELYIHAHKAAG